MDEFLCRDGRLHDAFSLRDAVSKLVCGFDVDTRCAIGGDERAPVMWLEQLSRDHVESVRCAVAGNKSTPDQVLLALSRDPSPLVRGCVAGNRQSQK